MTDLVFNVSKQAITQYLIGDASSAFSVADTDPVAQTSPAVDISNVNLDRASLVLVITNTAGTIAIDVDLSLSLDGTNNAVVVADVFSAVSGDGITTIGLASDVFNSADYQHFLKATLNKTGTGTCDARLYLLAQGA